MKNLSIRLNLNRVISFYKKVKGWFRLSHLQNLVSVQIQNKPRLACPNPWHSLNFKYFFFVVQIGLIYVTLNIWALFMHHALGDDCTPRVWHLNTIIRWLNCFSASLFFFGMINYFYPCPFFILGIQYYKIEFSLKQNNCCQLFSDVLSKFKSSYF